MVVEIKSLQEFQQYINSGKVVLIDFWATWCGPCTMISPKFEEHANKLTSNGNIVFAKVDVDDQPDISQEAGIRAMPTFMMFKDGQKIDELVGAHPGKLDELVNTAVVASN